jgi:shikimate kinase
MQLHRHVILIGLPGAGKSTVGRFLADTLHAAIYDIDAAVEQRAEMTISQIFESLGEDRFRELERDEALLALGSAPGVIIPGGGWAAQPGNLESARPRGVTVYLHTTPAEAVSRALPQGGRPLLESPNPVGQMERLLAQRSLFYDRCDVCVTTDGKSPGEVAREVIELALQGHAG